MPEGSRKDELLEKIRNRIAYIKLSRRLEERYMLFGEIIDDERREAREEGHKEGSDSVLELVAAMCGDGKLEEIPRLKSDPQFLAEMIERYQKKEL